MYYSTPATSYDLQLSKHLKTKKNRKTEIKTAQYRRTTEEASGFFLDS